MSSYEAELQLAQKTAQQAAARAQNYQQKNNFEVSFKGRNDIVTDADVAVQRLIVEAIKNEFPDDRFLAEESARNAEFTNERTWIIDPIDGTTNFAHGFPVYCISIALWEHKQPRVGVVLEVNRDECFTAIAGKGAYLNGEPISVSGLSTFEHAMIGTGFPYNNMTMVEDYIRFFRWLLNNVQSVRRPGAASYDLCCVAAGRFDGFYEYSLKAWDVGAGALIVQEAGGVISDWLGGQNWLLGEQIIAGSPEIHAELLSKISDHFDEDDLHR